MDAWDQACDDPKGDSERDCYDNLGEHWKAKKKRE